MAAPPCPRLAAELTRRLLKDHFTQDIAHQEYQGYICFMFVLLNGGWANPTSTPQSIAFTKLVEQAEMRQILTPWLVPEPFSEEAITAMLVDRELFTTPPP